MVERKLIKVFQSANALQIYQYFTDYNSKTLDQKWDGADRHKVKNSTELTNQQCMRQYIVRNIEQCIYPGSILSTMSINLIKEFFNEIPDSVECDSNWLFDVARQCQEKLGNGFRDLFRSKSITNAQLQYIISVPNLYSPQELHEMMVTYLKTKNPPPENFNSTFSYDEVSRFIEKVTYNTDSFDQKKFESRDGEAFGFSSSQVGKFIEVEFSHPVRISLITIVGTAGVCFVVQASRDKLQYSTKQQVRTTGEESGQRVRVRNCQLFRYWRLVLVDHLVETSSIFRGIGWYVKKQKNQESLLFREF